MSILDGEQPLAEVIFLELPISYRIVLAQGVEVVGTVDGGIEENHESGGQIVTQQWKPKPASCIMGSAVNLLLHEKVFG